MKDLNAKRFAAKPLRQPRYDFRDVPRCHGSLKESSIGFTTDRNHFLDAMAEMVLLCKEAVRRKSLPQGKKCSKPLSLEYMADRLDVDDPMFGYLVRSSEKKELQGFITVTTFTNWQKTFRWDSMHDSAFSYDDEEMARQISSNQRKYDRDGTLAEALQATVRCGDPWNEGIVWPRIAEISLLGGLGCGKTLVSLAIEKLERLVASGHKNYDYVVLQATDNSIPFYESLGFVRVGCITEDLGFGDKQEQSQEEQVQTSEIVSSAITTYVTKKKGETPYEIARKFQCDVWDIIFLNQFIYPDIVPRSRLVQGTSLYCPSLEEAKRKATSHARRSETIDNDSTEAPQWFVAKENDTPRAIAKMFHVDPKDVVLGNRERLPQLQANSRLKEGTRIKVSHFHLHDDVHVPYCHWTFPDDTLETSEPSYMMALKLDRKRGMRAKEKPVETSLAVPLTEYQPPKQDGSDGDAILSPARLSRSGSATSTSSCQNKKIPAEPVRPKRPLSAYMIFCGEKRPELPSSLAGKPGSELLKALSQMWQELDAKEKLKYQAMHEKRRATYQKAKEKYEQELTAYRQAYPDLVPSTEPRSESKTSSLFNKVVQLVNHASEFQYYYVLTYIPDLQWCHLAPLRQVGRWGPDKPRAEGRPIWMLVDEKEGKELDISASFCQVVKARSMKRTPDADQEQWDIVESGPSLLKYDAPNDVLARVAVEVPVVKRGRGRPRKLKPGEATAPKGRGRPPKAKPAAVDTEVNGPLLNGVRKRGPGSELNELEPPTKRKRGRPRKNKVAEVATTAAPTMNGLELRRTKKFWRSPPNVAEEATPADLLNGVRSPRKQRGRPAKVSVENCASPATRRTRPQRAAASSSAVDHEEVEEDVPKVVRAEGPFAVGSIVEVASRMWPGINKQGGVARVTRVERSANGSTVYDVSYVLGGREKNVDSGFVSGREEMQESQNETDSVRTSPRAKRNKDFRYVPPAPESATPKKEKRTTNVRRRLDGASSCFENLPAATAAAETAVKREHLFERKSITLAIRDAKLKRNSQKAVNNSRKPRDDSSKAGNRHTPARKAAPIFGASHTTRRTRAEGTRILLELDYNGKMSDAGDVGAGEEPVEVQAAEPPTKIPNEDTGKAGKRHTPARKAAPMFDTSHTTRRTRAEGTGILLALDDHGKMTEVDDVGTRAEPEEEQPAEPPTKESTKPQAVTLAPIFTMGKSRSGSKKPMASRVRMTKDKFAKRQRKNGVRDAPVRRATRLFGQSKDISQPDSLLLGARRGVRATRTAA